MRTTTAPADSRLQLLRLAGVAREIDAHRIAQEAEALAERVAEGAFYVACVGQFKRGKSTLLDALLEDAVLPTGIVPVTAVPTVVRFGRERSARVHLANTGWHEIDPRSLVEYVSEECNPENEKGVTAAEVFLPVPLLASGMCLVDTPGLGSVFASNTESTRAFVPQIDAAIVVIGADPPLSGDELSLIEDVARHVDTLLFVLNKADRVSEPEKAAASAFARTVLERRLRRPIGQILEVSATARLRGNSSAGDWEELHRSLEALSSASGARLSLSAGVRGVFRLTSHLLAIVHEQRDALLRPIEETQARVDELDRVVRDAENSLNELSYLFAAEQRRLSLTFEADRKEFLEHAIPHAQRELSDRLPLVSARWGPRLRREMLHISQEIARDQLTPWLRDQEANAEEAYRRAAARFVDLANEFLHRFTVSSGSELSDLAEAVAPERGFRAKSNFYFNELIHISDPASPFRLLLDALLGVLALRAPFERAARSFLERLLSMNATRVQSDVDDRVAESRRLLESRIRALLDEVRNGASRALARARSLRESGVAAVEAELSHLQDLERELAALEQGRFPSMDPR